MYGVIVCKCILKHKIISVLLLVENLIENVFTGKLHRYLCTYVHGYVAKNGIEFEIVITHLETQDYFMVISSSKTIVVINLYKLCLHS